MATTKQKAKNANKIIFFILFIFFAKTGFSQKNILGVYHIPNNTVDDGQYTRLEFYKNGNFKKNISGEFGNYYYGNGTYSFNRNKLILNYNKTKPLKTGHHISRIYSNSSKTIDIHFKFFDFDNNPIPYVNVAYEDNLSKYGYSGIVANEKGTAELNVKKDKNNIHIKISNAGFKFYEFTVDKNYNYEVSVFLQKESEGLPIKNQIDTLNIIELKPLYFRTKDKNRKIITWNKVENKD